MNWFDWILAGWLAFTALSHIALVGTGMNITPSGATLAVMLNAAFIVGLART